MEKDEQVSGAALTGPGSREPDPAVPALRASIPSGAEVSATANAVAKTVADRLQGGRPVGTAPHRYATIFQAARAGAIECMTPSTGVPCELCGKSVRLGHYVNLYDDIGEAHVNCEAPDAIPGQSTPSPADDGSTMQTYRMVGSPLVLEPVEIVPAQAIDARSGETEGLDPEGTKARSEGRAQSQDASS